jgi:hypothetical protein
MFDVYLLALLACISSINATDHPIKKDAAKIYEFFVRDASGKAATAFYLSKRYSVVDKLPPYAKDSKIINNSLVKKEDIDRAMFHGTHELLVTQDIKHASASSGISLVLSALWNTADHFGLSQYITTDSDELNALAYGFIHSICLLVAKEQIKKLF